VKEVRAYKLDFLTTDEVRLDISVGDEPTRITLSEEMVGFRSFAAEAEAQLGFPVNWWTDVVKPAFEINERVLYRHA
jgi:hypothetical protein